VVPQELVFDPFFTVRETLRITAGYYGVRGADAWIDEVLEGLGLTDKAESNMRALSGGMKRRVMVAQALIHRPPVIVLDEPTAGVDIELRQSLWRFVRKLNHDGHTIVLTTHYLEEAQALCNRVAVMKAGRIVALDETDALLKRFSAGALLLRIFRRRRQAVRVARAGMWSNPGCESLFHPYVGVMFMPAGGRNHVRHRGGRQLRCRRIRQTFQEMGYSKP